MEKFDSRKSGSDGRVSTGRKSDGRPSIGRQSDADFPPDSITIPITDESSWPEMSPVYDREDSTTGSTNPKSQSSLFPWSKSRSGSKRVAATNHNSTSSAPIIGLPAKIQRPCVLYCRRPPPIFPKWRNNGSKKSGLPECEPGSPKVSCIGKVLSERERERRRRKKEKEKEGAVGCWDLIFHCAGGGDKSKTENCIKKLEDVRGSPQDADLRRSTEIEEIRKSSEEAKPEAVEVVAAPPAICGMKKYSSGRRAASWGDDTVQSTN